MAQAFLSGILSGGSTVAVGSSDPNEEMSGVEDGGSGRTSPITDADRNLLLVDSSRVEDKRPQ